MEQLLSAGDCYIESIARWWHKLGGINIRLQQQSGDNYDKIRVK